jgi:glycosyltransferase involved in cell wall biosynthesis
MNKALTITIVIPVYNEEDHLKGCLNSIAAQTVEPDDVIVVDNNSTDKSVEIARQYNFVRVIKEKKQGIVYARDAGFEGAKSDIIGRIDGDSILPRDWVEYVKKFYETESHRDHALTGGGYFYNLRLPRLNGWLQGQLAFRVNRFVAGHYILWGSNMAIMKSMWQMVNKDLCRRDDIHEDMDLAIHLHNHGTEITYHEGLRVKVKLKRAVTNRKTLKHHMSRWPNTLRAHGYKKWWMGVLGNLFLWYVAQPFFLTLEFLARLMGKKGLPL